MTTTFPSSTITTSDLPGHLYNLHHFQDHLYHDQDDEGGPGDDRGDGNGPKGARGRGRESGKRDDHEGIKRDGCRGGKRNGPNHIGSNVGVRGEHDGSLLPNAKNLWNVCKQYGQVVDAFIPDRKPKAGSHHLHANIARFMRPPAIKSGGYTHQN
nr:hypothetical protein [Tanacetum cinerariifolium]